MKNRLRQGFPATKIVATLGPATFTEERIDALVQEGMSIARLNFSHGKADDHRALVSTVRRVSAKSGRPVAILQDLQGPKVRLGLFPKGPVALKDGDHFSLTTDKVAGDATIASVDAPSFSKDVRPKDAILVDDGKILLRVESITGNRVRCLVERGGTLSGRKGVNVPARDLSIPSLTSKDRIDLRLGVKLGVDAIALSFVRCPDDVVSLRKALRSLGSDAPVVAKIEKPSAVERLDGILAVSDGVLVARGDLGVEVAVENVPALQKRILASAARAGAFSITATQMLESMTHSPIPTRAEVSDVANAVEDGTDAVMLSAETSVGEFPVEAVAAMRRIVQSAERDLPSFPADLLPMYGVEGAVADGACRTARKLSASAIVVLTRSGRSARIVSKFRPKVPIIAFAHDPLILPRLSLYRGVVPFHLPGEKDRETIIARAVASLRRLGMAPRGAVLVFVYGSSTAACDQMRVITAR